MSDPALENDLDAGPQYTLRLVAHMAAEPHILAAWAADTKHPVLQDAYTLLAGPATTRAAALARALIERHPALRKETAKQVEKETQSALTIRFEPSRLKWLMAARRDRIDHQDLPGYHEHRQAEQEEADQLEALMGRVLRTMC